MIARTVKDVILFDSIFSDCHYPRPDLVLKGTRLGYPVNYWKGLDTRVRAWDNNAFLCSRNALSAHTYVKSNVAHLVGALLCLLS